MGWIIVVLLALAVCAVLVFGFRQGRNWETVGAAVLLGLAGYALQGNPGLPGQPKPPAEKMEGASAAADITTRQKLSDGPAMGNKPVVVADALARHGQYADAAGVLRGAVEKEPGNAEAWLALGNALVAHAGGMISPSAMFAYGRAAQAAPQSPGPPFFMGMALIQSGKYAQGRALWADILAHSPADAPWHKDLEARLGELDKFLATGGAMGQGQ